MEAGVRPAAGLQPRWSLERMTGSAACLELIPKQPLFVSAVTPDTTCQPTSSLAVSALKPGDILQHEQLIISNDRKRGGSRRCSKSQVTGCGMRLCCPIAQQRTAEDTEKPPLCFHSRCHSPSVPREAQSRRLAGRQGSFHLGWPEGLGSLRY